MTYEEFLQNINNLNAPANVGAQSELSHFLSRVILLVCSPTTDFTLVTPNVCPSCDFCMTHM